MPHTTAACVHTALLSRLTTIWALSRVSSWLVRAAKVTICRSNERVSTREGLETARDGIEACRKSACLCTVRHQACVLSPLPALRHCLVAFNASKDIFTGF